MTSDDSIWTSFMYVPRQSFRRNRQIYKTNVEAEDRLSNLDLRLVVELA